MQVIGQEESSASSPHVVELWTAVAKVSHEKVGLKSILEVPVALDIFQFYRQTVPLLYSIIEERLLDIVGSEAIYVQIVVLDSPC